MTLPPWTRGPLRIRAATVSAIECHARDAYPSECCGFVTGPADDVTLLDAATREVNEADAYHAMDPARFPHTSRTYFRIDELRAARAFESAERAGRPIKVIYHSHCDAGAYFSAEDAATFAFGGQLMWPCAFLVVSVVEGEVEGHALWVHRPGTNEFVRSSLERVR